ncbi:MAG: alpha/beta hydrolase [Fimbriimonadaceae bacterium]|nr:alpha/beta hydrolase [Fimbriimonadaceae bacterium]
MLMALVAATLCVSDSLRLWTGDAPGALGQADQDIPTLTPYLPKQPCGTAIVICPGGGYGMLADHEGRDYALWLNRLGISAFVLKYRLGSHGYRHPVMLQDASRALRTVRYRAKEWGIDPAKIGIMGSSAGGHLASTLLTHFEAGAVGSSDPIEGVSSRPNFGVLCYAVISFGKYAHVGSRENLIGKNPDPKLVEDLSNELRVTASTPPCFIWSTADDGAVPVENSLLFASALRQHKVAVELHVYESGPHGIGLQGPPDSDKLHPWTVELARWLKSHDWAN